MLEQLLKKEIYSFEFEKLRSKLHSGKIRLDNYEVTESVTLAWVLYNEDFVTKEIIKTIKDRQYNTPTALERKVRIEDKDRLLYAFDWHEKILQGALASLLTKKLEPLFSNSLQSYRKGRGIHNTLLQLSDYLKKIDKKMIYILKKDVKGYGDNIPHDKLLEVLTRSLPKNDYVLDLIRKILGFKYYEWETGVLKTKRIGLPTGSPLNNIMANVYLADMDHKIDGYSSKSCYFRYGDDILVATDDEETSYNLGKVLKDTIGNKMLNFNEEKELDFSFEKSANNNEKFKYLGLMINSDGSMRLTKKKDGEIKEDLKQLLSKINIMISELTDVRREKITSLISSIRTYFYRTDLMSVLINYFPVVNDEDYWKDLDLWIGRTLLNKIYNKGGDRVFARYSFKELRKNGLPSIRHLRRLYLYNKKGYRKYTKEF